ncbi:hypothetical protein UFOVP33_45 [uncultured Caudovirales phage]|uniref:Uncharacterized protein n=1 Tax=uncultured Caudovirales phage TaxID=2100421 RepID=A0A6J5KR46_9CAUD|nr:hypothetical protein UFOVP33_45 [uncultured Caudovirales phage]
MKLITFIASFAPTLACAMASMDTDEHAAPTVEGLLFAGVVMWLLYKWLKD